MSDSSFDEVPRSGSLERGLSASSGYSSFRRRGTALANDVATGQGTSADSPVFTRGSIDRRSGERLDDSLLSYMMSSQLCNVFI